MRASKAGCDSLTVTQFHYTGWPDHDIPNDFDVILEMMAEMREIKSCDEEKAPMVIHCRFIKICVPVNPIGPVVHFLTAFTSHRQGGISLSSTDCLRMEV